MTKTEFKNRIIECGERSFYAQETITNVFTRNPIVTMSWGFKDMVLVPSKDYPEEQQGFMFKVSGLLFSGAVLVTLGWEDLFCVRFFEHTMNDEGGMHLVEREDLQKSGIYVDQLLHTIDRVVETKVEQYN